MKSPIGPRVSPRLKSICSGPGTVSKWPGGNRADEVGNGAWRSLDSSSGGTDECTSASRESLRRSMRLDRAEIVWLPRNSRTLEPETTSR